MKVCTWFLLFKIFAYTISSPLHSPKGDKRNINLDLNVKGALEFNVNKNSIKVLDKKLTGYPKISRRDSRPQRVETFTGFIQEVIKILYTYDDNTFEDFFNILDKEIRKYHYRGYKFHELTDDYEIRNLLAEKVDLVKGKSIREVAEIIKHKVNDKNVKRMLNYINSIFKEDAREMLRNFLTVLKDYGNSNIKEPKNNITKKIRNGVRAIFFNHYTNLDAKEKSGLKKEIIVFLKGLTVIPLPRSKANFSPTKPAVSEFNSKISKTVTHNVKKPEIFKKGDPTSTVVQNEAENERRKTHSQKINDELSENEETTLATSEEESDSQQLVLTFVSTEETYHESTEAEGYSRETATDASSDETVHESSLELSHEQHRKLNAQPYDTLYIEDFYKTTEKPQIKNKSKMKSKLAEGMSMEGSTDRLPTARPNTKRLRHKTTAHPASKQTKKVVFRRARPKQTTSRFKSYDNNENFSAEDLRRSIAPPVPNEELSVEVFDRERRKREEALAQSYTFVSNNSFQHGLNDYVKRRRHLDQTINELKKIQENNQRSRMNVTTYNGDEVNNINKTKGVNETQSKQHEFRAQTEEHEKKVRDIQVDVKETNLFKKDEIVVEKDKETLTTDEKQTLKLKKHKKKFTDAQNTERSYKNSTEVVKTSSKLHTSILESVKNPVFSELLTTTEEKRQLTETTSKATQEVYNATLNVKKEIIIEKNATTADIDEDTRGKLNLSEVVTPSTRRSRRVLKYSYPLFY